MNETAAESHVLARRAVEPAADVPRLARIRRVVVLVTVNRGGEICDVKPLAGPKQYHGAAVETVTRHWRFRPFLVDWKPVVAQFPLTIDIVLPRSPVTELSAFLSRHSARAAQGAPDRA